MKMLLSVILCYVLTPLIAWSYDENGTIHEACYGTESSSACEDAITEYEAYRESIRAADRRERSSYIQQNYSTSPYQDSLSRMRRPAGSPYGKY